MMHRTLGFPVVAAVLTALLGCTATPILLHEDLPAYSPVSGPPECRFGYHRVFRHHNSEWGPAAYFNLGARTGQRWRFLSFQEGLLCKMNTDAALVGAQAGIGLVSPVVSLSGTWMPFSVKGVPPDRLETTFDLGTWWQMSLLAGTGYRPHGLGWSAGGRIGKHGIGPVLAGEFGSGVLSLRAELSASFRAPWASEDVRGQFFSLGIGTAHHGRQPQ